MLVGYFLEEFLVGDACRPGGLAVGGVDEHQVDVRTVVQLLAAELAEGHDGEAARLARGRERLAVAPHQLLADAPVTEVQDGVGEVRKLIGDVGERGQAEHVAEDDAEQLPAPEVRHLERGGHAGGMVEELGQAVFVLLAREHAVEVAGLGKLQDGFGEAHHAV